jgi:hypothetical protein
LFKLMVVSCAVENLHQVQPAGEGPLSTVRVDYASANRFAARIQSQGQLETMCGFSHGAIVVAGGAPRHRGHPRNFSQRSVQLR